MRNGDRTWFWMALEDLFILLSIFALWPTILGWDGMDLGGLEVRGRGGADLDFCSAGQTLPDAQREGWQLSVTHYPVALQVCELSKVELI